MKRAWTEDSVFCKVKANLQRPRAFVSQQEVAMKIFPHTADASADIPADQGDENVSSVAITAVGLVLFVGAVAYLIFWGAKPGLTDHKSVSAALFRLASAHRVLIRLKWAGTSDSVILPHGA
jgi:hypothetical protein